MYSAFISLKDAEEIGGTSVERSWLYISWPKTHQAQTKNAAPEYRAACFVLMQ